MYIRAECATSFAESVALASDAALASPTPTLEPLRVDLATAAAYCSEAFVRNANDMIQIHGGIGYTWEHDAHLFLRRAVSSSRLFGRPDRHMEYLSEQIASRGMHLGGSGDGSATTPSVLRSAQHDGATK
jgi:acyl-CoA dehydrogenase